MSHFNEIANEWDSPEKTQKMKSLASKVLEQVSLNKDLDILDFGGGTGLFGLEFENFAKSLEVIDTSEAMIEVFKKKTTGDKRFNSRILNLESQELNSTYDLIVSSMAFHHLNNPQAVLKKLAAALNDGGKILIVDLDKEDGSFHPDNKVMGVKHFGFSKEDLEGWGRELGLKTQWTIINEIPKNDRIYGQFLMIYSK